VQPTQRTPLTTLGPSGDVRTVRPSSPSETLGFEEQIKPLFRERHRDSMKRAFDLWDYDDVSRKASAILTRLRSGSMPCDDAWPSDRVDMFQRWIDAGKPH
jgi:hypothetical protein